MKCLLLVLVILSGIQNISLAQSKDCIQKLMEESLKETESVIEYVNKSLLASAERDLARLVAIPSVSNVEGYNEPLHEAARTTAQLLRDAGLQKVRLESFDKMHPIVTAEHIVNKGLPTVLIYAHYDVVDPGDVNLWTSPPFSLTQRGGRFYGRGCADDKGGIIAFTTAIKALNEKNRTLPVNIKAIIEGNEEYRGRIDDFIRQNAKRFSADYVLIIDSSNENIDIPALTNSTRGSYGYQVTFTSSQSTLHSGQMGNAIRNPMKALTQALANLEDQQENILLPGLYERLTETATPFNGPLDRELKKAAKLLPGVRTLKGEKGAAYRVARFPAVNYTAIQTDAGPGEVSKLPSKAFVTLAVRAVPGMDPQWVRNALLKFFQSQNYHRLRINVETQWGFESWRNDPNSEAMQIGIEALSAGYGVQAVFHEEGGTIPLISTLETELGAPILLYAVEDLETSPHGIDENASIQTFHADIRATIYLLNALGKTKGK